jgi:hypothetical protein
MPLPLDTLRRFLRDNAPAVDHVSIRAVSERSQNLRVRQDVPEAPSGRDDTGAMVTVTLGDAVGCGATSDLSDSGLRDALKRAEDWARASRGRSVFSGSPPWAAFAGTRYETPTTRPADLSAGDRRALLDMLMRESQSARPCATARPATRPTGRGRARPLAFGIDISGLQRDTPEHAIALGAQGRADVDEAHRDKGEASVEAKGAAL